MRTLDDEIAAFEEDRRALEADSLGKWVVYTGGERIGIFGNMDEGLAVAMRYPEHQAVLLRQVGQQAVSHMRVEFAEV